MDVIVSPFTTCPKPHLNSLFSSNLTDNWRTKNAIHPSHCNPKFMSFTNVRLQQVKSGFSAQKQWPRERSGNVKHSSEKLQSYILLHRPALELLHLSAPTHEISSSLFSSAWHFPRLYLLLYFPHTKDNWVLNIAPIRQRDVLNGLFSLPPAVHRLCMYLIHNMVNNWFFSACSTSKRNQKLFFFFSFFLFPRGKKKELFVLNFHFVCHLEWFSIWWVFITKEMEKSWSQDSQAPIAILQQSFFPWDFPQMQNSLLFYKAIQTAGSTEKRYFTAPWEHLYLL